MHMNERYVKHIVIGAMAAFGVFSVPKAKAQGTISPICMTNSIVPYCAIPTAYTIAANGNQSVSVNLGASYILLQVTSGTVTVSSSGALGNISNVSGSPIGNSGNITQTFGVGQYYIIVNGQTSFSINSVNGAYVEVGQVTNAPSFVNANLADLGKNIETSLMNSQGNSQILASVLTTIATNGGGIGTLTTNLNNEVTRATGAENTITSNLNNEVNRATSAESALVPRNLMGVQTGIVNSQNPNLWSGQVTGSGSPSTAVPYYYKDLPVYYSGAPQNNGSGAVAEANQYQAIGVYVISPPGSDCTGITNTTTFYPSGYTSGYITFPNGTNPGAVASITNGSNTPFSGLSSTYGTFPSPALTATCPNNDGPTVAFIYTPVGGTSVIAPGFGYTAAPTLTSSQTTVTLGQTATIDSTLSYNQSTMAPSSLAGAPDGIPTLDKFAMMNSPIDTSQSEIYKDVVTPNNVTVHLPMDKAVYDSNSMFTIGAEGLEFGGLYDTAGNPSHRAININGQPYGNYNQGCTLCVFSTASGDGGGGGQAAISGIDYRAGASAVNQSDYAAVGFYHFDENWNARVTAQAASFGAGVVTLTNPMTDEQMATLHTGMYIDTNVVNPNDSTTSSTGFIQVHSYRGYIKSWDATHIYVYDWAVPGDGNESGGQVPDVTHLDSALSTYTVPMIWAGVPSKNFAENEYMVADGTKAIGPNATTDVNAFEREEFDFRANNWSLPQSVSFHGWTTSFQCTTCVAGAMDEGSYAYLVNGPMLPQAYIAQLYGDGVEYRGYSTWLGSNGPPELDKGDGNTDSTAADVPVGTNHIMAGVLSSLPSNNNLQFSILSNKEQTTSGTWVDYGVRMGVSVDANRDRRTGLTGGSGFGQIGFNTNGDIGSICLMPNGGTISALCAENGGTINLNNNSNFASGFTATFNGTAQFNNGVNANYLNISSSASTNANGVYTFTGQGAQLLWNAINGGEANTEFVNVDPTGGTKGFSFYNVQTGQTLTSTATPMMSIEQTGINLYNHSSFYNNASIMNGGTLSFNPTTVSNNLYPGLTSCGSYTICTTGNISANVGFQAGNLQGINNSVVSQFNPDSYGNFTLTTGYSNTTATNATGGGIAEASYTYATLPSTTSLTVGMRYFCSNCYSPLRSSSYTKSGIDVVWNGSDWTDVVGNPVSHP